MVEFDRKLSILVVIFDFLHQIRPIFDKIKFFWYKFEFKIEIRHGLRIVATISMDFSNKFGSEKSIKRQFKYNLDRILAGGRSNRISLLAAHVLFQ